MYDLHRVEHDATLTALDPLDFRPAPPPGPSLAETLIPAGLILGEESSSPTEFTHDNPQPRPEDRRLARVHWAFRSRLATTPSIYFPS
jgi:hypothetical protein